MMAGPGNSGTAYACSSLKFPADSVAVRRD